MALVAVLFACGAALAGTHSKPLFELGVAAGGGYLPDYLAADESHVRALALPFVAYRGEFVRSDEKGLLRGRLLSTERLELDLSLTGSFPADADDNEARRGMPDLDWLGEIGPRLQITIARAGRDAKLEVELPLRVVFSTDFSTLDYRGVVFAPDLAYQHDDFLRTGLEIKLGGGASFATRQLMDYFYEVESRFATPARPAFSARPGYLGAKLQLTTLYPIDNRIRSLLVVRADSHHGAANRNSPLFRADLTASVGVGLIWSFYQSERRDRE